MMNCRHLNLNLLASIKSPVLSFQATKYTAPTFKQISRHKYGLDRKRNTFNKKPKKMDTAKVDKPISHRTLNLITSLLVWSRTNDG